MKSSYGDACYVDGVATIEKIPDSYITLFVLHLHLRLICYCTVLSSCL